MTSAPAGPAPGAGAEPVQLPPLLVWPATVSAEQARARVARRLPEPVDLDARLYHHPFLGLVFECRTTPPPWRRLAARRPEPVPMLAHVVVDLVGGRAYLSDPWDETCFVTAEQAAEPTGLRGPQPVVDEETAVRAGRAVLAGVLLRRRRLDTVGRAELLEPPLRFGKPNWWVTGRRGDRRVEVIVDALTGRHYACSA